MAPNSIISQPQDTKAIVVGICLNPDDMPRVQDDLKELKSLLATLGVKTVDAFVQKRHKLSSRSLLGSGKVEEVGDRAKELGAELVVFDHQLSGPQVRNLEEMTCCAVLDRHGVILEIFAKHARTNQAKTQVEIAQLEYMLPRLVGQWTHFQRQTGGRVRARGMGEKQIEIDRRRAKERIARLKSQLQQISKEREVQRKARRNEIKVALVGYTNSGKTTLLNSLTKAQTPGKDELFATLDSNVKTIDPNTRPKILLSDTVGFIRNLPHSLVESFKSTLDEVLEADLLLHVVDVSHNNFKDQMATTDAVLEEIGAADIPVLLVFNKVDLVDDPHLGRVLRSAYPGSTVVSAISSEDAVALRDHIFAYFVANFLEATIAIPHDDPQSLSLIHKSCLIKDADYSQQDRAVFRIRTTKGVLAKLQEFLVADDMLKQGQEYEYH